MSAGHAVLASGRTLCQTCMRAHLPRGPSAVGRLGMQHPQVRDDTHFYGQAGADAACCPPPPPCRYGNDSYNASNPDQLLFGARKPHLQFNCTVAPGEVSAHTAGRPSNDVAARAQPCTQPESCLCLPDCDMLPWTTRRLKLPAAHYWCGLKAAHVQAVGVVHQLTSACAAHASCTTARSVAAPAA